MKTAIVTIVDAFKVPGTPIYRSALDPAPAPARKPFVPFPTGTVSGPYTCGKGTDPVGGVQFLVQTKGGWVPFIRAYIEEAQCRADAEAFALKHKAVAPLAPTES